MRKPCKCRAFVVLFSFAKWDGRLRETSFCSDSLARIESGRTEPTLTALVALAQRPGVSVASNIEQQVDATTEA